MIGYVLKKLCARLLIECILRSKPINILMDLDIQSDGVDNVDFVNKRNYKNLVRKLIYFTLPYITFVMSVFSQYMC